jgi:cytochrome c553
MRLTLLCFILFIGLITCACGAQETPSASSLPQGNASEGELLFSQTISGAPACSTCHSQDGSTLVGPTIQGYGEHAGTQISGVSAEDYTYASIIQPPAYIVSGFSNTMYSQYAQRLSSQQIADLIAFLLAS